MCFLFLGSRALGMGGSYGNLTRHQESNYALDVDGLQIGFLVMPSISAVNMTRLGTAITAG